MKRSTFFTLFLLGATVLAVRTVSAQQKVAQETPSLLYRVTGRGLAKPSYVFGTFHAICAADMVPFESLDKYLTQTDQLLMEIDMDDPAQMLQLTSAVIIPDGKTVKEYLTAEQFAKVDEMMKSYLGYSAENVKMIKPMMLSVLALTSPKAIGCTPVTYDLDLMKSAVTKKKPVAGLETVESQTKVIDSQPLEKQAKDLYEIARDPEKAVNELKKLVATYKLQDPDKLFEVTISQLTKEKEFQARLLDERNIAWIPKLEVAFSEKPTFVAVGAGHLGGEKGVIKLLRAKGYRVVPVKL